MLFHIQFVLGIKGRSTKERPAHCCLSVYRAKDVGIVGTEIYGNNLISMLLSYGLYALSRYVQLRAVIAAQVAPEAL